MKSLINYILPGLNKSMLPNVGATIKKLSTGDRIKHFIADAKRKSNAYKYQKTGSSYQAHLNNGRGGTTQKKWNNSHVNNGRGQRAKPIHTPKNKSIAGKGNSNRPKPSPKQNLAPATASDLSKKAVQSTAEAKQKAAEKANKNAEKKKSAENAKALAAKLDASKASIDGRDIVLGNVKIFEKLSFEEVRQATINRDKEIRSKLKDTIPVKSLDGIFALPYQFNELDDRRIPGTNIGTVYGQKIATRMPLLFLSPGDYAFFNGTLLKGAKIENAVDLFFGKNPENINGKARYASFSSNYADYYTKYVNPLCTTMAKLMGISNEKIMFNGKYIKIGSINWQDFGSSEGYFKNYFNTAENIVFYTDANPTTSDSISNSTRSSAFAGLTNGVQDAMKEFKFMIGTIAGIDMGYDYIKNDPISVGNLTDSLGKMINNMTSNGALGIANSLLGDLGAVAQGGRLLFPDMWDSSDFGRNISYNIKLRSPYKDPISRFINIAVPLIHLICLAGPRKISSNGIGPPFLVRGYSTNGVGFDMGIISSLDISKGDTGSYTLDGMPTEVDISLSIKELYSEMSIVGGSMNIASNPAVIDYLSTFAGNNIMKANYTERVDLYLTMAVEGWRDSRSDFMLGFNNFISKAATWGEGVFGKKR